MRHGLIAVTGMVVALSIAPAALGAPPQAGPGGGGPAAPKDADDATKATARKIAEEGLSLFNAGQYVEALERFERAGTLVRAPTMGLMAGRSLVKLGRFVEASERFLTAAQMKLDADASDAFRKAQVDAGKEREAIQPRIPSLTIVLEGGASGGSVTLDGKTLEAGMIGAAVPVDPGQHTVVVTRDKTSKTERLQIQEGEQRRVVLALELPPSTTSGLKVAGITGLALGGAGLVAFAVSGGLALSLDSELRVPCKDGCPPELQEKNSTFETLKVVTTASLVTGLLLVGTGALLVGLAPSAPKKAGARPFIGVGSAGLKVVF
jgi:hypothetical protein